MVLQLSFALRDWRGGGHQCLVDWNQRAESFELRMILDTMEHVCQQDCVSQGIVTPDGRKPSGEAFCDVVEGIAQPGKVWPKHLEDIHGIDEPNGS